MFFSYNLLDRRHPAGQIWLAAHKKLKSRQEFLQAINSLDDGIKSVLETRLGGQAATASEAVPNSLRSASVLMYGCVLVYGKKLDFLKDDSQHALTAIQQSSVGAAVDLPANVAGNANAVTLPPASDVDYENLAYLANTKAPFRFVREGAPSTITLLPDTFEGAYGQPVALFDEDFYGMVEASTSSRSGLTPDAFRGRSQSAEAPERFRAAGDPEQPNWETDILRSPFAMPGNNNDDAMDYGQPAGGGDYDLGPVHDPQGDRLSAGPALGPHGFTPGSIGGALTAPARDSLPGAPGADLPGQEATFKTPQSAKGKKKSPGKGTPGEPGATPGKGALKNAKHKSPVGPKRRKLIIDKDGVYVLRNREIREMLENPAPTLGDHPKLPGTANEVLRLRLQQGERLLELAMRPVIASAALDVPLSAVHPALQRLYRSRMGAAAAVAGGGAAAEADGAEAGPSTSGKKRKSGAVEGAEQHQQQKDEEWGAGGSQPNDHFFEGDFGAGPAGGDFGGPADDQSQPPPSSRGRGSAAAASEIEEGRVQFLDGLEDRMTYIDQENVHLATQDKDGWSEFTQKALLYVHRRFKKEGLMSSKGKGKAPANSGITLTSCIGKEHRLQASKMFFELLVLQNKRYVTLDQPAPFGEVTIRPGSATVAEMAAAS